jgi:hypothetical protein
MRPRADPRRRLHHVHLARALHAPQRADEQRERLPLRRGDSVEVRRSLGVVTAREVPEEERRARRTPTTPLLLAVVPLGHVDVHVLRARGEGAQVVGKAFAWAGIVRAEERDDVCEACRCAVPLFFGRVCARAVQEHAEAARGAGLLCWRWRRRWRHAVCELARREGRREDEGALAYRG